jgi:hypothetical protein
MNRRDLSTKGHEGARKEYEDKTKRSIGAEPIIAMTQSIQFVSSS